MPWPDEINKWPINKQWSAGWLSHAIKLLLSVTACLVSYCVAARSVRDIRSLVALISRWLSEAFVSAVSVVLRCPLYAVKSPIIQDIIAV